MLDNNTNNGVLHIMVGDHESWKPSEKELEDLRMKMTAIAKYPMHPSHDFSFFASRPRSTNEKL